MAALTYRAEILANNKSDRMTAAGSVSPCNPPLVSLCCHRLSEAAESAGLTWLSFGTDGLTVDLVNTLSITQRDTLVGGFWFFLLWCSYIPFTTKNAFISAKGAIKTEDLLSFIGKAINKLILLRWFLLFVTRVKTKIA